jgi:hypothetical protein
LQINSALKFDDVLIKIYIIPFISPFCRHKEPLISFRVDLITNELTGGGECASGRAGAGQRTEKDEKAAPHKELARRSFYFCLRF